MKYYHQVSVTCRQKDNKIYQVAVSCRDIEIYQVTISCKGWDAKCCLSCQIREIDALQG